MKEVLEIADGIFLIEDFIIKEDAENLVNSLKDNLMNTEKPGVSGINLDLVEHKNNRIDHISVRQFSDILTSMNELISNHFKENHLIKNHFISCLSTGYDHELHMDNYYLNKKNEVIPRDGNSEDKSAILYLNDDYEGGQIYFPNQNLEIKPKIGSILFFEGSHERPHGVRHVVSGQRFNIITFYGPVN